VERPETRYVRVGGIHVAYQVVGEGPPDILEVPNWLSHVEAMWELPWVARFYRRLASFARVIVFDQPGTGLSDAVPLYDPPTLDRWMDYARVVLDEVESERAALLAMQAGGALAAVFAAAHPERTSALVLCGSWARLQRDDEYPFGLAPELREPTIDALAEAWGTGAGMSLAGPSMAADAEGLRRVARFERLAASPGAVRSILEIVMDLDIREVLPAIRAPTLVLHREADRMVSPEHGRYLAAHIPGAQYVELPGEDHLLMLGDNERAIAEIREFLTGVRAVPDSDRVLATLLFTDIVGSTERLAALGDRRWAELLALHDEMVRGELELYGGREADTTGDGFLATFDGPARAIRCAQTIRDGAHDLGLDIRAGLHTGECELRDGAVKGIAVHVAARVVGEAGRGELIVSSTVRDLVAGSGIRFAELGSRRLKGLPQEWRLFRVLDSKPRIQAADTAT
jgi:class 3 adenylate cyclase